MLRFMLVPGKVETSCLIVDLQDISIKDWTPCRLRPERRAAFSMQEEMGKPMHEIRMCINMLCYHGSTIWKAKNSPDLWNSSKYWESDQTDISDIANEWKWMNITWNSWHHDGNPIFRCRSGHSHFVASGDSSALHGALPLPRSSESIRWAPAMPYSFELDNTNIKHIKTIWNYNVSRRSFEFWPFVFKMMFILLRIATLQACQSARKYDWTWI